MSRFVKQLIVGYSREDEHLLEQQSSTLCAQEKAHLNHSPSLDVAVPDL